MANEFVARNGFIALSNSQITGSFDVLGSGIFTNNLTVTGSSFLVGNVTLSNNAFIYGNLTVTGSLTSSGSTATSNAVVLAASGGFAKSFAIVNNKNLFLSDTGSFPAWRCNVPCTASMVLMYQDSGSSVVVNATKNGSNLLASDLTNTSLDTWVSSSTLQNQNFNVGDILGFTLVSFSGSPKEVTIQTSFNY
jgi:hypothetical protein